MTIAERSTTLTTAEQLTRFVGALFDVDSVVEIRALHGDDARSSWHFAGDLLSAAESVTSALASDNAEGWNIFIGANPRSAKGKKGDAAIQSTQALWAEFDGGVTVDEALARIESYGLPAPAIVVFSGHGVHCYWILDQLTTDLEAWKELQRDIAVALDADRVVFNPERIMRAPGFVNRKKNKAPVTSQLIDCDADRQCTFDEIRATVAPRPQGDPATKPQPFHAPHIDDAQKYKRCLAYVRKCPPSVEGENGSNAILRVACECIRFDLTDADAINVLREYSSTKATPPWSEKEIAHKLASAHKHADSERGSKLNDEHELNREARRARLKVGSNGEHVANTPVADDAPTSDQTAAEPAEKSSPPDSEDRATELANAEELCSRFGKSIHYNVDRGEFYVWKQTHWQRDHDGQVVRFAKDVARQSSTRLSKSAEIRELVRFQKSVESAHGIRGVLTLVQTEPGIAITADRLDRDDFLLNVANGTLELRTGKLRAHDPADLITHCLSTPYDADAKCELWESVVNRAMAESVKLIGYLQRWGGLACSGSPNTHELLIAYGIGANGKSVIFDTLCGLLESLAGVAPDSLLVARNGQTEHPTEIADLLGKRLIVASETESGATLRLQLIKRLTGDSTIKARFMRQDFFEFRRTHKLVLITNNRPRLSENTEAVWRRLRLLPFNVVIPAAERDPDLLEKLRLERPGILAWCVRGFADYLRDGMNPPDEVLVATNEYRDESDYLAEFIQARCIVGEGDTFRVARAELFTSYVTWAKACGEQRPLDRNAFYEAIRRRDGIQDSAWKFAGAKVRGFVGIGLTAPTTEGGR